MNVVQALRDEKGKLEKRLRAIKGAIAVLTLNGSGLKSVPSSQGKRVLSTAARARISRATKARWAKYRAGRAKKGK